MPKTSNRRRVAYVLFFVLGGSVFDTLLWSAGHRHNLKRRRYSPRTGKASYNY
ncbi:hypothetical protein ABIC86_004931 [Paenibacillus sp. DS2363]